MATYDIKNIYNRLSKSHIFIIVLCSAAFFYLGYFLDLSSLITELTTTLQSQQDLINQYEKIFSQQSFVAANISHFDEIKIKQAEWQKKLVKASDIPEVLNEILQIGALNNLQFNLFNPGAEIKQNNYIRAPIKIIVVGSYNQIANFISGIANMSWVAEINKISIIKKVSENADTSNRLVAEINVDLYRLNEKKT